MLDVADMTPEEARTYLGRFLFTGDDVFRPVRLLSGGEKNKLALAQITHLRPNLLILDEPTNHLDLDSREALAKLLAEYEGTLLLISHDRYLLDQATNRTLYVAGGQVHVFEGTFSQYRAHRERRPQKAASQLVGHSDRAAKSRGNGPVASKAPQPAPVIPTDMNFRELSKARQKAKSGVQAAEDHVAALEARLQEIEAGLADPASADNAVALANEHGQVQDRIVHALAAWEEASAHAQALDA
jgi:ATP-binding cassette subfamily F protein 3